MNKNAKKSPKEEQVVHKSFVLSNSPIKNKPLNNLVSIALMVILAINVATLIYAHEILKTINF